MLLTATHSELHTAFGELLRRYKEERGFTTLQLLGIRLGAVMSWSIGRFVDGDDGQGSREETPEGKVLQLALDGSWAEAHQLLETVSDRKARTVLQRVVSLLETRAQPAALDA